VSFLTLEIRPTTEEVGWTATWSQEGELLGQPMLIGSDLAETSRSIGRRFSAIFDEKTLEGRRPFAEPQTLRDLGLGLKQIWFDSRWEQVRAFLKGPGPHHLLIRSPEPEILNLPWELIEIISDLPLGCDAGWALRRAPEDAVDAGESPLLPGPLRVLVLAAAPSDQCDLFYEREEEVIFKATADLSERVVVHLVEPASFRKLADLVPQCQPHIVHLSGHAAIDPSGTGYFAFEDEHGATDSRAAGEIVSRIFRGSSVRCVLFNGCQTSQAAASGLCQALVSAGLPLAVGWSQRMADDRPTEFTEEFYRRIICGESVTMAAAHARELLRRSGMPESELKVLVDATYALPQLYGSVTSTELFDTSASSSGYNGPRSEPFLLGDGIVGLRRGYIGRRQEIKRLLDALRSGDATFALITGSQGVGKSALATRVANRLEGMGYEIAPVRASSSNSRAGAAEETHSKLVASIDRVYMKAGRTDFRRVTRDSIVTDDPVTRRNRLKIAVEGLNSVRDAFIIDNFEAVLDPQTHEIAGRDLAWLYGTLASDLTRGSRIIVTSRDIPSETPACRLTVLHLTLQEFGESEFIRFMRFDPDVESRLLLGELSTPDLASLFTKFGGNPGSLELVRALLRTADIDELLKGPEELP